MTSLSGYGRNFPRHRRSAPRPGAGRCPHDGYRAFDDAAMGAAFPDFHATPPEDGVRGSALPRKAAPDGPGTRSPARAARDQSAISRRATKQRHLRWCAPPSSSASSISTDRAPMATADTATTDAGSRWPRTLSHISICARANALLDVGCAKGFLVKDLLDALPGLEAFGIDISEYALRHCPPDVVGRLHLGNADRLPFPDGSFACIISLDTLHNLPRERASWPCRRFSACRPAALRTRRFLSHRGAEGGLRELGLDPGIPRLSRGMDRAVSGSRLYRRLWLDHHRIESRRRYGNNTQTW